MGIDYISSIVCIGIGSIVLNSTCSTGLEPIFLHHECIVTTSLTKSEWYVAIAPRSIRVGMRPK